MKQQQVSKWNWKNFFRKNKKENVDLPKNHTEMISEEKTNQTATTLTSTKKSDPISIPKKVGNNYTFAFEKGSQNAETVRTNMKHVEGSDAEIPKQQKPQQHKESIQSKKLTSKPKITQQQGEKLPKKSRQREEKEREKEAEKEKKQEPRKPKGKKASRTSERISSNAGDQTPFDLPQSFGIGVQFTTPASFISQEHQTENSLVLVPLELLTKKLGEMELENSNLKQIHKKEMEILKLQLSELGEKLQSLENQATDVSAVSKCASSSISSQTPNENQLFESIQNFLYKDWKNPDGFLNIGNSCYLNSGLQLLRTTGLFHNLSLLNSKSGKALSKLFRSDISIEYFLNKFAKLGNVYDGNQQDPWKFIGIALEKLRIDDPLIAKQIMTPPLERTACPDCGGVWIEEEIRVIPNKAGSLFSVGLSAPGRNFKQVLENSSLLEVDKCQKCQKDITYKTQRKTKETPNYLFLRTPGVPLSEEYTRNMLNEPVEYYGNKFEVIGVALHSGRSWSSGHYASIIRHGNIHSKWFYCDDRSVREISLQVATQNLSDHLPTVILLKSLKQK